jgi:hypothetical protein
MSRGEINTSIRSSAREELVRKTIERFLGKCNYFADVDEKGGYAICSITGNLVSPEEIRIHCRSGFRNCPYYPGIVKNITMG